MVNRQILSDWVCGEAVATVPHESLYLQDPNTGSSLEPMASARPESIEAALERAVEIHRTGLWWKRDRAERANVLDQIANGLEGRTQAIAEIAAARTGVVITQTDRFARLIPKIFRNAAQLIRGESEESFPGPLGPVEVHRMPLGPALCIAPWNAPTAIAAHKVASSLAAGCPTILKPSEWAPHTANLLAEAIHESELPPGTFQLLHGRGDVGAKLTGDERIRAVSFTGGLAGGRAVAVACAEQMKPAQLELGGNNPLVVLHDADVEQAADGVVMALTRLNGQWCRALGRILVHQSLEKELMDAIEKGFKNLRVGSSLEGSSEMGPLIHRGHLDNILGRIHGLKQQGGRVHQWTSLPEGNGFFCAPTVITGCSPEDTREEIFGPVAALHTFDSEDEMFQLVHQAPYGLAAYIYGDEERAMSWSRRFEVGSTKVNGVSVTSLNPMAPRSAWRLSGLGVEGHHETYDFFRGIGVVGVAGRAS